MQLLTSQLINKIICSLGCFFVCHIHMGGLWLHGCVYMCVKVFVFQFMCRQKLSILIFILRDAAPTAASRVGQKKKKCAWPAPTPGPDPSLSLEWESLVNPALGGGWAESTRRLLCWLADCLSDFRFYFPNGCTHKMPPQPPMSRGVAMQRLSAVR